MIYFNHKIVWITGASSGIGEALAFLCNKYGATVILSARNSEELNRVQQSFENKNAASHILPLDLEHSANFEIATKEVIEKFGKIDILINNAGISQRALAIETSTAEERKIFEINVMGTIALTKAVLPFMLAKKTGQIVVINSVMGKISTKYRSAYAASKHALIGYFDCLRLELDNQIKITTILPGFVNTNIVKNAVSTMQLEQNLNQEGLSPIAFAEKALKAIAAQKEEVYIGGFWEGLGLFLKRLSPTLFSIIIKRKKVV